MKKYIGLMLVFLVFAVAGCGTQDAVTTDTGGNTGTGTTSPASQTITQSGTGVAVAPNFSVTDAGNVLFSFTHNGGSNFIVELKNDAGTTVELLANEIGPFTGQKDVALAPGVYHLSIDADGAWTAGITGFITASANATPPVTGGTGALPSFELLSITPSRLGLKGSGSNETGTIVFSANGISDGAIVNFTLDAPTGGAEIISAPSSAVANGEVSVDIKSGSVAGVATVTAATETATGTITTEARITMGYSKPDQKHIGIAAQILNVPGHVRLGLENTITAYVADRFSNPVPAGTPVYFASECGIMALEDAAGVTTNLTNNFGIATATSITAEPRANDGLCQMLIWTEGEEEFTDRNGNGIYDEGEQDSEQGIGEPYIDANDSDSFDVDELYFDLDGNGQYTAADNVWDADTFVWTSQNVLWSAHTAPPSIMPEGEFNITGSKDFTVTAADIKGNSLPAGTTIKVTTTCSGTLSGDTDVTLLDAVKGRTKFNFRLTSEATEEETCSITVEVSAEINGTSEKTIYGTAKKSSTTP